MWESSIKPKAWRTIEKETVARYRPSGFEMTSGCINGDAKVKQVKFHWRLLTEKREYDRCNRCSMRLTVECSAEGKMPKSGASQNNTYDALLALIP